VISRKESNRRLLKLASLLWKLPKRRFHYGDWVGSRWAGKPDLSCGTTACALGWATTIPEFAEMGLHLRRDGIGFVQFRNHEIREKYLDNRINTWATSLTAAQIAFGLSLNQARFLFIPNVTYQGKTAPDIWASPRTVSQHIRSFVRSRSK
jgi:hypothetical protein